MKSPAHSQPDKIPLKKNLIKAAAIYILILLFISITGLYPDTDTETVNYALKYFSQEEINTGLDYFTQRHKTNTIYRLLAITFLLVIALRGHHNRMAEWLAEKKISSALITILSFAAIFLFLSILRFPFALFSSYYKGKEFGLMNADLATWILRYISWSGIYIIIAALALSLISFIINKTKRYMLYIPAIVFVLSITITIAYPRFITPLFYKMEKLPQGKLKQEINAMLNRADIKIDDIYTIDSGRISNTVNAYMTGFSDERRIVLYDTLINNYSNDEILSVLAHELCHYKEEHVLIGLILFSLSLFILVPFLSTISKFFTGGGIKSLFRPGNHAVLIIIIITLLFISRPFRNSISRYMERRADLYSLSLTENPAAMINMKKRMALQNRTHILPDKIYVLYNYTHPPVLERIRNAGEYQIFINSTNE